MNESILNPQKKKKTRVIFTWSFFLKYYEPKIKGHLKLTTFPPIPLKEKKSISIVFYVECWFF